MIRFIRKRDGRLEEQNVEKIAEAIYKAFLATEVSYDYGVALDIAKAVEDKLIF